MAVARSVYLGDAFAQVAPERQSLQAPKAPIDGPNHPVYTEEAVKAFVSENDGTNDGNWHSRCQLLESLVSILNEVLKLVNFKYNKELSISSW